ncbi:tRNA pseudouridine(13) synthase TruD [Saccharospirillum mangrovi]|uniref:tRNA pseudouridine(13) synthase TruD n=1 Tax=Saccharospirillum mangrovi TaxID=2161747 RepID=UPI000D39F9A6|nr:tRNA pseudouridine(13) synthase TruD [Saccharospirillum mangrovi]
MSLPVWPRAWGESLGTARLKVEAADFQVTEVLPETPSGEGEHLWLTVEKTGQNTAWLARKLANWANLSPRDVSYAGLKDRHAVTTQTFSLHLPGRDNPVQTLAVDGVRILKQERHHRKLKTGQLVGNDFRIRLRDFNGDADALAERWAVLVEQGFPNYFGPQRFGQNGANLERARGWFNGDTKLRREQRGIHLSAVRSYLFNTLLAQRVADGSWNQWLPGDYLQFREGQGGFVCLQADAHDLERVQSGQLSPTASMPGRVRESLGPLDERETAALADESFWIDGLTERGIERGLRKLRVFAERGRLEWQDGDPVFHFFLPSGSYATTALRELVTLNEDDSDE